MAKNDNDMLQVRAPCGFHPPMLSVGKTYHVFIAHSSCSPDREFVIDLVQLLESEGYGLKVCYHERDFIPGYSVIQNISTAIRQSMKTIVVLSKNFQESRWCLFEAELTVTFGIDIGESKLLIPIQIQDSEIPVYLKRFDVIDAQTNPRQWIPLLLEFICESSHDKDLNNTPALSEGRDFHVCFVYSEAEADAKFIDDIITKLTTTPLEYKCLKCPQSILTMNLNEVEFGNITSIVKPIQCAQKTVLLVSKHFTNSSSKSFLSDLFDMLMCDLQLPGGALIPIVTNGAANDCFGDITYLNVSSNIDDPWWSRFLEALSSPGLPPMPPNFACQIEDLRVFRIAEMTCCEAGDKCQPRLVDVVMASENRFVISDSHNRKLKLYSLIGNLIDEFCSGDFWASSMARVKANYIVAAYGKLNVIRIFHVKNNFEVFHEIHCSDPIYGIASFDDQSVVVSYREGHTRLNVLSYKGEILKTFQRSEGQQSLLINPRFIGVNEDDVFVVDIADRRVLCYRREDGMMRACQNKLSTEYHIMRGIYCGRKQNYVLVDNTIKTVGVNCHQVDQQITLHPFMNDFVGTTYMRSISIDPSESVIALIYACSGKEMIRIFGLLTK